MPSFDIVRECVVNASYRVECVRGQYDLPEGKARERFRGELPLDGKPWKIGAVVGPSGSGKSTIAGHLFPDALIRGFEYRPDRAVVDDMPEQASPREIFRALTSVGFASPPSWLKPYAVLSTGEKMRVDIARALLGPEEMVVFDEFTSVVDRTVAQVGSAAIAKAVRRSEKRFVAVSCHYDILDWLCPDWVFSTDTMEFSWWDKKKDRRSGSTSIERRANGQFLRSITI